MAKNDRPRHIPWTLRLRISAVLKDVLRESRKSFSRFLAIMLIIMIGTAFFYGFTSTPDIFRATADTYYDDSAFWDIEVLSTIGVDSEDIAALSAIDGVEQVQGGFYTDALVHDGDREFVVRLHALNQADPSGGLNRLELIEGRLPEKSGEIALAVPAKTHPYSWQVGDTLEFVSGSDTALTDTLATDAYTIVGLVKSAEYYSVDKGVSTVGSGVLSYFGYIPRQDFLEENVYYHAMLTVTGAKELDSFSDEYQQRVDTVMSVVKSVCAARSQIRVSQLREEADAQLAEGRAQYEQARQEFQEQIAQGQQELDDARARLEAGAEQLAQERLNVAAQMDAARQQIAASQQQLIDGEQELQTGQVALDAAKQKLAAGEAEYAAAVQQYNQSVSANSSQLSTARTLIQELNTRKAQIQQEIVAAQTRAQQGLTLLERSAAAAEAATLQATLDAVEQQLAPYTQQLNQALAQIDSAQSQLSAAEQELANGKAQVAAAEQQLAQGQAQLVSGRSQIRDAQQQLANGQAQAEAEFAAAEQELADGWEQYRAGVEELAAGKAEGQAQLADAVEELIHGEEQVRKMLEPDWYFLDRAHGNYSHANMVSSAMQLQKISQVFPVFFFLVAALVCLTTMTRMVDEQRGVMGLYKALGYSNRQIMRKYLLYAVAASFVGGLGGSLLGHWIFPKVLINSYVLIFDLPGITWVWNLPLLLLSIMAGLIITGIATLTVAWQELRECPAAMMRPKAPKAGQRVLLERLPRLWKRLSFSMKVTVRNLFRYKKKFFMTVIGISGCTALLLAAFGINDTLNSLLYVQYSQLYHYQVDVRMNADAGRQGLAQVEALLDEDDNISDYLLMHRANATVSTAEASESATLAVPLVTGDLRPYLSFRHLGSGEEFDLPESGLVVCDLLAQNLGIKVGDTVTLDNGDGVSRQVPVSAITEQYIFLFCYMAPEAYRELFGYGAGGNSFAVQVTDTSLEKELAITKAALATGQVSAANSFTQAANSFGSSLDMMKAITAVLILMAALLAAVVLYNLTNINIMERVREIATLKVLGFFNRETYIYILRENLILAAIGAGVGLGLGVLLLRYVMSLIQVAGIMFGAWIYPLSFAKAFLLTMVFALAVSLYMTRRIRQVPMVESLKSVE